jgi:hypothetical protein
MDTVTTTTPAITTAAIAGTAAVLRKILHGKQTSKSDHITRQEFHDAIDATRNSLTDKLEATAKALALSFETCRSDFEHSNFTFLRLISLSSG